MINAYLYSVKEEDCAADKWDYGLLKEFFDKNKIIPERVTTLLPNERAFVVVPGPQNIGHEELISDELYKIGRVFLFITGDESASFNVEKIKFNLEKYKLAVGLNIVTSPGEYDIRHIPLPVRKIIANQNPSIANFIMQTVPGCDILWPKFWKHTKDLDQLRGQSFEDTFPEFYELIKPYV